MTPRLRSRRPARGRDQRRVVVHATGKWLRSITEDKQDFFTNLAPYLAKRDVAISAVQAGGRLAQKLLRDPQAVHLLVDQAPVYGPRLLHANPAPISGFWHLDELGQGWNSSLRLSEFDPETVDHENAVRFFNDVSSRVLRENISQAGQTARISTGLLGAAATVFCQPEPLAQPSPAYLTTQEMITTTANHRRDGLVYVKLHPRQTRVSRQRVIDLCGDIANVRVSEASVHDLIAASAMVVTQNSTVGFEALMQKRPVVTCAKASYWHAAMTAHDCDDLREALTLGADAMRGFPYERYFFWTLARHGFEPAKEAFAKRVWARICDKAMWPCT